MAAKRKHHGDTKRCAHCKAFKPLTEFPVNRTQADGRAVYCRPCKRSTSTKKPSAPKPQNLTKKKRGKVKRKAGARGPDSSITHELIELLCKRLRRGHSRRAAARKAGINEDTLAKWMSRGAKEEKGPTRELHDAVLAAEGEGEFRLVELVRTAAKGDPLQARWLLERRYSQGVETWVRKEHIDVSAGPEVPEVSVVRELIAAKLRGLGGGGPAQPSADAGGARPVAATPGSDDAPAPPAAPPPAGAPG